MENIGLYLKKLREESSLSINEISEKSKIKNYLLERLEKNDFKSIGEVGYARIVLVSYTRELDGDVDKVLKSYNNLFDEDSFDNDVEQHSNSSRRIILLPKNFFPAIGIIITIIILSLIIFNFYQKGMLVFPFNQTEKLETSTTNEDIDNKKPTLKKIFLKAQNDVKFESKSNSNEKSSIKNKKEILPKVVPNSIEKEKIALINESSLHDTIDYVNILIFNEESSPFNIME